MPAHSKILIIEDDNFLRDLVTQKLSQQENVEPFSAMDGEEGWKLAQAEAPDVILLDIMLPGIDGFEVLKRVRAEESLSHTAVIMLSNLGKREDIEKAQSLGADMFLIKASYTLDEIVEKVGEVAAKRHSEN